MRKSLKVLAVIAAVTTLLATNLFATLSATLYLSSGYRDPGSVGGEFTAVVTGGPNYVANYSSKATAQVSVNGKTVTGFETFCVETTVSFTPNQQYSGTVGSTIVPGSGPYNYIAVGTAYLYSQFAQGILSQYNYTVGSARELCADELQDAIWYLQGEIGSTYKSGMYSFNASGTGSKADPFLALVESMFGSKDTESDTTYGNNFGVQVLNLYTTNSDCQTVYAQDQLVYCPVPEPATFAAGLMLLVPLGVSTVRALRKKI